LFIERRERTIELELNITIFSKKNGFFLHHHEKIANFATDKQDKLND